MEDQSVIIHIEKVGPATEHPGSDSEHIVIEVTAAPPGSSLSAEARSLYISKEAADDLVQTLGKYLLALE